MCIVSVVFGVEAVEVHVERAGGVVYLHRCPKLEVTVIEHTFCTSTPKCRCACVGTETQ